MDQRDLANGLVDLAVRATAVDIRSFEERDVSVVRSELLPMVRGIVEHSLVVIDQVLEVYEREEPPDLEDTLANFYVRVDRVLGSEHEGPPIADLAFLARMELGERYRVLRVADRGWDRWFVLGECDGALRRVRKAAAAIEGAVATDAGFEPRLKLVSETTWGRMIRASYAHFRREVEGDGPPADEEVRPRLDRAAAAIARLRRREFYRELRVGDRAGLRGLHDRIQAWLRGEGGHDAEAGRRIWHDLRAFAMLLAQVNRRTELVAHDRALVGAALITLEDPEETNGEVPPDLLASLEALSGLRDSVDELLEEPVTRERAAWVRELRQLREQLGDPEHGAEPPGHGLDLDW